MRVLAALFPALLLIVVLAGCGDDDTVAGARLRVLTGTADGPLEGELKLQSLDDGLGTVYETQALGGDMYVAPGAPDGKYRPFTTAGWGMLWSGSKGSAAPYLRGASHPATYVRLGKPRSLYVASAMPGRWTLSATWGAEWRRAEDGDRVPYQPVALEIEEQDEGIYALRFPPEVWRIGSLVRVVGLMTDGTVTAMQSYQLRDEKYVDLPRLALMLGATQAPLTVHLVPPPGVERVPDDTLVRVTLRGVALKHTYEARSHDGRAVFDGVAALGHGVRVSLPGSGERAEFDLDSNTWRTRLSMHVVTLPSREEQAELHVEGLERDDIVLARYASGTSFGRVPLAHVLYTKRPRVEPHVHTVVGLQEWLIRKANGTWLAFRGSVTEEDAKGFTEFSSVLEKLGEGVRMRGVVQGSRIGRHVQFRWILPAHAEAGLPARTLGGEGFEAAISPQGDYEAYLPPGRYEIRVVGPGGAAGPAATFTLKPGSTLRFDPRSR